MIIYRKLYIKKCQKHPTSRHHPIFCLLVDERSLGIHHIICDFYSSMSRKTVHKVGFFSRHREELCVHLVSREISYFLIQNPFFPHRYKCICIDEVCIFYGFIGFIGKGDISSVHLCDFSEKCLFFVRKTVRDWTGDPYIMTEFEHDFCKGKGDIV